jgi:hypothetical protein
MPILAVLLSTPADSAPWWGWLLLAPATLAGLWLPGRLALARLPSPERFATDVLGSLLLLFFAVLACDTLRIPISLASLSLWLALGVVTIRALSPRNSVPDSGPAVPRAPWSARGLFREAWWALPCFVAFGSVLVRGVVDPLAGWDNVWRWNHLALLMRDTGSLAAYPPVSAADFRLYPWCDGIPPLVPVANLWIYLATGSTCGGLIVARLALELGLTGFLVWRLAAGWWGPLGARLALLVLAGSALFLGSVALAQETGLTGVFLLIMVAAAFAYQREPLRANAVWLALAAAGCALCRDYNLLFAPLALGLLLFLRAPRTHLVAAAAVLLLVAGPWYLRNALRTGNPLFAHDLGGWLPTNPFHAFFMAGIRAEFNWSSQLLNLPLFAPAFMLCAAPSFLWAAPAFLRRDRRLVIVLGPALATTLLWVLSVGSTAGGLLYSLRVLGPALPLLAVLAGAWANRPSKLRTALVAALTLLALDAGRRQWLLLNEPLSPPLRLDLAGWQKTDDLNRRYGREALWSALAASGAGDAILVDHPFFVVVGGRLEAPVVPLFSPQADPLTQAAPNTSREEIADGLRRRGVRFVVLDLYSCPGAAAYARHPGLARLLSVAPAGTFDGLVVYDLLRSPPPVGPALP